MVPDWLALGGAFAAGMAAPNTAYDELLSTGSTATDRNPADDAADRDAEREPPDGRGDGGARQKPVTEAVRALLGVLGSGCRALA